LSYGKDKLYDQTNELGNSIRKLLESKGFKSVAEEGYKSPTVIVSYKLDKITENMVTLFKEQGIQIAAGVPWKLDEKIDSKVETWRIGLFGLDKLKNINQTISEFESKLDVIIEKYN